MPASGSKPHPLTLGIELPRVGVVGKCAVEDRMDVLPDAGVLDRYEHLDPVVEVSLS